MTYILWLYLASISNRFRRFGVLLSRCSLLALALEYLVLAQPQRPVYADSIHELIGKTYLALALALLLIILPSREYILGVMSLYRRDQFLRGNIIIKLLRLAKLMIKHDLLNLKYRRGLYQRLVTATRLKWVAIGWYFYDLYKGYRQSWSDLFYLITAYFAFACATWVYVHFTGANLYYYPLIEDSYNWGVAILSFIILKVIFLPDFSVLFNALLKIGLSMLIHKLGLSKAEYQIDQRLASYEQEFGGR